MSMFLINESRGFVSAFDADQAEITRYIEYCEATRKTLIWIEDEMENPLVFLDSGVCYVGFSQATIDRLAMLAMRHGASDEPEPDLGQLCVFEFKQLDNAERFATAAADWLRSVGQFEPPKPIKQSVGPVVEYNQYFSMRGKGN